MQLHAVGGGQAGAVPLVREQPARSAPSFLPRAGREQRTEVRLEMPDPLSFIENVGYRYNVDKTLLASAAAVAKS